MNMHPLRKEDADDMEVALFVTVALSYKEGVELAFLGVDWL